MAEYEDLEDNVPEPVTGATALFDDDDDDDEEFQPGAAVESDEQASEDEQEDEPQEPAADEPAAGTGSQAPASTGPTDMKAKLMALAQLKRKDAAEGGASKKRRDKKSKENDNGTEKKRKRDKGTGKKVSERLSRRTAEEDSPAPSGRRPDREGSPQGSVDSRELHLTEADKDFIVEDEVEGQLGGLAGSEGDDEELSRLAAAPEAQEAEDGEEAEDATDTLFGRKKKKKRDTDHNSMLGVVNDMIAKMEAAADTDAEEFASGRAALAKLRTLKEVEDFVLQRQYHEIFISSGGLGVLKAWLEPYADGTLPSVRLRTALLHACKVLPIDTAREDVKESLKKSQLGSRIIFYAKCPEESQANRKSALELVQKWARPIFFDPEAEAEKRRAREESLHAARSVMQKQSTRRDDAAAAEEAAKKAIKYGHQGYRWHASIPQAMKLDYVVAPQQSAVSAAAATMQQPAKGKDEDRLAKKMRDVERRAKASTARAHVPSVEGRGIIM
mmetsp:Transcript_5642/g.9840  ORF Transcript_5642/g.9840 Transcript_5642/m.9840 type:complete len:501 (-) Transcript_5642:850-2352(-)